MENIIMSKWRKPLKNQRRFDARYFLNERVESGEVVENSVQQDELKKNFHDFSFNSWLDEGTGKGTVIGDEEEEPEYGEELEELVVPGVGPKPDGREVKGLSPEEIRRRKAKERGPVTNDPPVGLEEEG